MTDQKKQNRFSPGQIISAVIFVALMIAMVAFTFTYNPDEQFASGFFEDVANSIQWK